MTASPSEEHNRAEPKRDEPASDPPKHTDRERNDSSHEVTDDSLSDILGPHFLRRDGLKEYDRSMDFGLRLFSELVEERGWLPMSQSKLNALSEQVREVVVEYFMAPELIPTSSAFTVHFVRGAIDASGVCHLLVSFQEDQTGAFFLPKLAFENGEQRYVRRSPGMVFKGTVLSVDFHLNESGDQIATKFLAPRLLMSADDLCNELEQISHFDCRGAVSTDLERALFSHGIKLSDVQSLYVSDSNEGEYSLQRTFLVWGKDKETPLIITIGALGDVALSELQFMIAPKQKPLSGHSTTYNSMIFSEIRAEIPFSTNLELPDDHVRNTFLSAETITRCESWLKTLYSELPEAIDWKLRIELAEVDVSGNLYLIASIMDSDGKHIVPVMTAENKTQSFVSVDVFAGVLIYFDRTGSAQNDKSDTDSSFALRGMYIPPHTVDALITQLLSDPRDAVLSPLVLTTIQQHLIQEGRISMHQVGAVDIYSVYCSRSELGPISEYNNGEWYWLCVEHSCGTHLLRFFHIEDTGYLQIGENTLTVCNYFPLVPNYGHPRPKQFPF